MRVLILGGTGFIGPAFVNAALNRGHRTSVFNRGKSNADLPADVEQLTGDRNSDLQSIQSRDWDAVFDLAAYVPSWVRKLGEALKGRVKHYTFISTIMAYRDYWTSHHTDETSALVDYTGGEDPDTLTHPGQHYGPLKVLCEREAEKQFPARALILRPGYIVGPGDPNGALTYWPVRLEKGGETLVAGEPAAPVQFIDVRDLAAWAFHLLEHRVTGTYNAVGPAIPMRLDELLKAARAVARVPAQWTWVPPTILTAQKDADGWRHVLFWTNAAQSGFAGSMRMANERALAKGLKLRGLVETLRDTLAWHKAQPEERQSVLATARQKRSDGSGWDMWPAYLKREREILNAWHVQQGQPR
jgi:2'-hydroxyisoflavone reductase